MAVTKSKRKLRSPALQYTYDRFIGHDPKLAEEFEEEVINADIARKIYDLRTKAGLSQRELAKKIGTNASVICRLEDADRNISRRIAQNHRAICAELHELERDRACAKVRAGHEARNVLLNAFVCHLFSLWRGL